MNEGRFHLLLSLLFLYKCVNGSMTSKVIHIFVRALFYSGISCQLLLILSLNPRVVLRLLFEGTLQDL